MGIDSSIDEEWMALAIEQAKLAEKINEVPVGAVLVQDDQLIASAHNQPISNNDPTAHAEIQLLRAAGKALNNYRLPNTTLYVTLEPCTMCLGAMIHTRILVLYLVHIIKKKLVFAALAWTFQRVNVLITLLRFLAEFLPLSVKTYCNNSLKNVVIKNNY